METTAVVPPTVSVFSPLSLRRGDRVAFFLGLTARCGEVVRIPRWGGAVMATFTSSAALAHEILVEQADAFVKGYGLGYFARPLLGSGLLTSEHDLHRRQRRLMAPAFVHKRIAGYGAVIVERAEAAQRRWATGATLDLAAEMMRLTLEIVGATLFGAEVGAEADELGPAITAAMEQVTHPLKTLIPIPPTWPTETNRRGLAAIARLDRTIYRLIEERRRDKADRGDFLSMLLLAQDEDDGSVMTDKQVRDEAMNIFLAGHETTANALAWTFYLLAQHPSARARLEREIDAALGGRAPALADLTALPYTLAVFKEAMRLYPPAFVLARRAIRDVTAQGYRIRRSEMAVVNVIGMHRRGDYFPEPWRFDPDRFLPENEKRLAKQAYLPFGAGPRVCIGNHFALLEGHLALATLAQRARFDLLPGAARVGTEPLITLRPKGGMPMRVTRRGGAAESHRPGARASGDASTSLDLG